MLSLGTAIPSGADLTSYTAPGTFYISSNNIAASLNALPESTAGRFMVETEGTTGAVRQIYRPYNSTLEYVRRISGATVTTWEKQPTRSEVDALSSKTSFIKSALNLTKVDSGGSKTFTVTSTTKSIMIAVATEPNDQGMWFLNARSNGTVSVTAIRETSNITFTTGTNTLTINNASPANVFVAVIALDGNGVTAQ